MYIYISLSLSLYLSIYLSIYLSLSVECEYQYMVLTYRNNYTIIYVYIK